LVPFCAHFTDVARIRQILNNALNQFPKVKELFMRFINKVAVVTGGGGEIGRATALRLAREGASVVVADLKGAEEVAAEIINNGGQAIALHCDVAKRADVEAMVNATVERFGHIDVACNIAGVALYAPLLEADDNNWDTTMSVNLKGVFYCTQIVARAMVAAGTKGAIVNMASTNGIVGEFGMTSYNASKFGVVGLTMTAAIELASHGIRVNAAAPGMIATKLSRAVLEQDPELARSYFKDKIPLGRFGTTEEVAAVIAFLASDDASFVTGHALIVDGGQLTF
jgi:NAD(P)-dependent dehydrogenase (short-subunit alcohol dehydrogenase family)